MISREASFSVPDTVSRVIQHSARSVRTNAPQPNVNNSAARKMKSSEKVLRSRHACHGRIALGGSRSSVSNPSRIARSSPVRLAASVPTSERTKAHEAPCIRSTHDGATVQRRKGKHMKSWQEITHWAGFDWAKNNHEIVIVDQQGQIVADFVFEHSLEGWQRMRKEVSGFAGLAVAIETNQGAAVDQLLQHGFIVYPVNPVAAASYRKRKVPSGTKTDHVDAWALADALRVDGHGWKVLPPTDPLT